MRHHVFHLEVSSCWCNSAFLHVIYKPIMMMISMTTFQCSGRVFPEANKQTFALCFFRGKQMVLQPLSTQHFNVKKWEGGLVEDVQTQIINLFCILFVQI